MIRPLPTSGRPESVAAARAAARRLVAADPNLPGLAAALDPAALTALVDRVGRPGTATVHRVRYKPGTSVQAAVRTEEPGGPRWWLYAAYGPGGHPKLAKDRRAAGADGHVHPGERWILTPAGTDRAVARARAADGPGSVSGPVDTIDVAGPETILAYNPRRRLVVHRPDRTVGTQGNAQRGGPDTVVKWQATPVDDPSWSAHLAAAGVPLPAPLGGGRHHTVSAWVPGRPIDPADPVAVAALADALAVLHAVPADVGPLPVRPAVDLPAAARTALATVARLLPDLAEPARRVARDLAGALARVSFPPTLNHGDLSPDQVVVGPDGPITLLDLDRSGPAPTGWDQAGWWAAQLLDGDHPVALPGPVPHPVLVAAACAIRSPEPFARQRADWPAVSARLVAAAGDALADRGAGP